MFLLWKGLGYALELISGAQTRFISLLSSSHHAVSLTLENQRENQRHNQCEVGNLRYSGKVSFLEEALQDPGFLLQMHCFSKLNIVKHS